MSTMPVTVKRSALKLPAGSVRAIHVLGIVALVCAIILMPGHQTIPPYLIYLLFMMVGHYFAAHGVTIATREDSSPSPLYLPGGTVRVLIILILAGCVGWKLYDDRDGFQAQFAASLDALKTQPYLPLAILGGFFVGVALHSLVSRKDPPAAWQDFEAWVSLIALIGLAIAAIIHLVIDPSTEVKVMIPTFDACLGAVVAFYFGERS